MKILKSILFIISAMLCLVLLVSCNNPANDGGGDTQNETESQNKPGGNYLADKKFDTDEYMEGFDADHVGISKVGIPMCASDDAYYMLDGRGGGDLIYYYDKLSGTSGPLCAKPDCMHNTSECSAYVRVSLAIDYYDGRLYFLDTDEKNNFCVCSCAPDGTDKKQVGLYEEAKPGGNGFGNLYSFCHRGYFYTSYSRQSFENGEYVKHIYLTATSISTGETVTLFDEVSNNFPAKNFCVEPEGNKIYIMTSSYVDGDSETVKEKVRFRVIDTKTREISDLCELVPVGDFVRGMIVVRDKGIFIRTEKKDEAGAWINYIELVDTDSGTSREIFSGSGDIDLTEECMVVDCEISDDGTVGFEAYDYDMNKLTFDKAPTLGADCGISGGMQIVGVKNGVIYGGSLDGWYVGFALDGSAADVLLTLDNQ